MGETPADTVEGAEHYGQRKPQNQRSCLGACRIRQGLAGRLRAVEAGQGPAGELRSEK